MASSARAAALVLALASVTAPALAANPSPADRETARALMADARTLRDKNDLKGALDRFQRADAIMHVPTTGLEVARTQAGLGMLVEARDTIANILHAPTSPTDPRAFQEARKNAEALDESLDGRVPGITIAVTGAAPGATFAVTVDDAPVPAAVIGVTRPVDPGHHVVVVKTDTAEGRQEVDVKEGENKDVAIALAPIASGAAGAPPPADDAAAPDADTAPPAPRSHALTYAGLGLAIAGLGVGAVTGLMVLSKKSTLEGECSVDHRCGPSTYGDIDSINSLSTISTVAFIAGGVGAAVTIVSLFIGKPKAAAPPAEPKDEPKEETKEASITPWIGLGAVGVRGRF